MSDHSNFIDTPSSTVEDDSAHQLHLGFERVKAELDALSSSELDPINLDIPGAVQTVLGTIPEVLPLRDTLSQIGVLDMRSVDHLRDYALALGHAHSRFRIASGTPDTSLVKELFSIRERFHADAQALVLRGILDRVRVNALKSGNNHQGLAYDVIGLCELFLQHWDKFGGRTLLEKSEVTAARLAANRLLSALGTKEQGPSANAEVSLLRQKAFTLMVRAYNDVRSAVAFVRRREGDVDDITPSLYAGRGRRPGNNDASSDTEADALQEEIDATEDFNVAVANAFAPAANAGAAEVPAGFPGAQPLDKA